MNIIGNFYNDYKWILFDTFIMIINEYYSIIIDSHIIYELLIIDSFIEDMNNNI